MRNLEIPMADPEDRTRLEGVSPDGRPRRQPPIIDVEAVEVSPDGSRATTAGSGAGARLRAVRQSLKRILTLLSLVKLSPLKLAIIGSVCVIAAIVAGALWIYLAPNGVDEPQRNAARPEAAVPNDAIDIAKPEAPLKAQPAQASPPPYPSPRAAEGGVGDLESRIAALDAKLAPLGERIAALERAVRDAAAAARAAGERADKVAGLLDAPPPYPPPRAGEGKEGSEEQNLAQQRSALEDLANRVAALESRQTTLQQKQDGLDRLANAMTTTDRAVRVATAAVALRSAVERNGPFAAELAAARSLGLDEKTLASLEPFAATGVPTRNELFRSLSALVPELRRLSMPPGRDLGYFDRLLASAIRMLNIRPVRDEPGDDPATIMSRIEFKMAQQDIKAMVAELDKLPAPARDLAQGWRTRALARQDALQSAQLIATASLAKLGEPAIRGPSPQ
jgi:hypothetical protein